MIRVPGGVFTMGNTDEHAIPGDGEGPVREVWISAFWIDPTCVTNVAFARFVSETGYRTDAETIGWSFVFAGAISPSARRLMVEGSAGDAPWWLAVRGANWAAPEGPGSDLSVRGHHPVVHVSWNDACTYASWAGKRLPTEAEWEKAARGGLRGARYPWGDELTPDGEHRCNIWQGVFPNENTVEDGFFTTAPVRSFPPNGLGLYEAAGNVWEWCADWWSESWHTKATPATRHDPQGPHEGYEKTLRGGSYLCHASYCERYRVAARTRNTPDASAAHTGFRCAADG